MGGLQVERNPLQLLVGRKSAGGNGSLIVASRTMKGPKLTKLIVKKLNLREPKNVRILRGRNERGVNKPNSPVESNVWKTLEDGKTLGEMCFDNRTVLQVDDSQNPELNAVSVSSPDLCPICLQRMRQSGVELGATQCGHVFCKSCILSHLNPSDPTYPTRRWCPVCRKSQMPEEVITLFI